MQPNSLFDLPEIGTYRGPVASVQQNIETAETRKQNGMERVEAGAPGIFNVQADEAIRTIARRKPVFTTDDVWPLITVTPPEPRAMGPRITAALRDGIIAESQLPHVKSTRPECNRRPIPQWKSLIYEGGEE